MSILKDLWIEEYHRISCEAADSGKEISKTDMDFMAHQAAIERFASLCDDAKDRAKYKDH